MKWFWILMSMALLSGVAFSQQSFHFKMVDAGESGNGYYSLNEKTGQVYFMWDAGSNAGKWKSYGSPIDSTGSKSFEFQMTYRGSNGTGFFALDMKTGQVYYMWDFGSNAGKWRSYGSPIDATGKGDFRFSFTDRGDNGNGFFAIDSKSCQLYYMWDFGSNAGKWRSYGNIITK